MRCTYYRLKSILFFCMVIACSAHAVAVDAIIPNKEPTNPIVLSANYSEKLPNEVLFGVYLISLHSFDFKQDSFNFSCYAWWKTTNKNYKPTDTVEIANALTSNIRYSPPDQEADYYLSQARYYGQIHQAWDITHFPFDHQILTIAFEDFALDKSSLIFKPDLLQSNTPKNFTIPGWDILNFKVSVSDFVYDSSFGDASIEANKYSRLIVTIDIKRHGWRLFFTYYVGFILSAFLCAITMFIDIDDAEEMASKLSLVTGAIFATVGNKYILDNSLPASDGLTLSDIMQITSFGLVLITVIIALACHDLYLWKKKNLARWIYNLLCSTSLIAYIVIVVKYLQLAINS